METIIKQDFQINLPFEAVKKLKLSVNDKIEMKVEDGRIIIEKQKSKKKSSLKELKNTIKIGHGNIEKDLELVKKMRVAEIAKSID